MSTLAAAPETVLCTLQPGVFRTFSDMNVHRENLLPHDVRPRLEPEMFLTMEDHAHGQLLLQNLRRGGKHRPVDIND